jgi:GTP-binding protein
LAAYDENLASRPQLVVATKTDALDEPSRLERLRERAEKDERPFYAISSATREGVRELVNAVSQALDEIKERRDEQTRRHADEETPERSDAERQEAGDAAKQEDEDAAIERGVGASRWSTP